MRTYDVVWRTAAFYVLVAVSAEAALLRVPEDYPTIVAAVDASASGDSVSVGPGTWTDTSTRLVSVGGILKTVTSCGFLRGGVTVFGRDGRDVTVVDAQETGAGFVIPFVYVNEAESAELAGLTIAGANGTAAAVVGDTAGRMTITRCRISNNAGAGFSGYACPLTLEDTEVSFNGPGISGGTIVVADATAEIRRCRIEGNMDRGVWVNSGSSSVVRQVTIVDCEILDNVSLVGGGGVTLGWVYGEVSNNLFARNSGTLNGGGLYLGITGPSGVIVQSNTFIRNDAASGGGAYFSSATVDVVGNTFYGCTSTNGADAVVVSRGTVGFTGNIIAGCSPTFALGQIAGNFTAASGCNLLWNNTADTWNWTLFPTDFTADPLFCDPANLDLTVSSASPCVPGNTPGCAQIGAWGPACGPVSVQDASWGVIKGLYRGKEGTP